MPNAQQWGRNESLIWPPRGYLYTLGAFFLACVATGLFLYLRFELGLPPLERYYLPYYLRSEHLPDALCFRWGVFRSPGA
jgi:hypothetical protein